MVVAADLRRALLQLLMSHGATKEDTFLEAFKELNTKFHPEQSMVVDEVLAAINEKVAPFDQKITKYEYGLTNEIFYVFHSTSGTSASMFQNTYTEDEIDYFKTLLRNITQNENLTITPLTALNLCSAGKIKKKQAEKLLKSWTQSNYFKKHIDNQIYLGPKLLCEFKELLQSFELNYLRSCLLCESIAIWGERCTLCSTIFHRSCIRKYFCKIEKCPSCREKWEVPADN